MIAATVSAKVCETRYETSQSAVAAATHTLLGFGSEGFVEDIGDGVEDISVNFLLCIGVNEDDADGPVTEWETLHTRVCARTV